MKDERVRRYTSMHSTKEVTFLESIFMLANWVHDKAIHFLKKRQTEFSESKMPDSLQELRHYDLAVNP